MKVLMILALAAIVYSTKAATLNKRDVRSELLNRAATLEKNATAEATKLRAEGRTMSADILERDARRLAAVARELEHALPLAIIPLELELGVIERRIAEEIRRDQRLDGTTRPTGSPPTGTPRPQPTGSSPSPQPTGSSPRPQPTGSSPRPQPTGSSPRPQPTGTPASLVKRDVRSELLTRAAALEKNATAEATKLRAEGRTMSADILERDARRLAAVARELEHALPLAIIPLELELGVIERRIAEEIRRDQRLDGTTRPTGSPPTGTPRPQPTGSSPSPQPTGSSPRPQPTGSSPSPRPTGSSPRPQPTGSSPRPQPTGTPAL